MCKCNHKVIDVIPGKQRGFNYLVECPTCGTQFLIKGCHYNNSQRIYCSIKCRHNAPVKPKRKMNKFKIANGRIVQKSGYVLYRVERGVYQYEHRYVMEQHLGRKLESHEVVHHIDHDRANNKIENLELTTHSHNAREAVEWHGVRPKDPATGRFI